MRVAQHRKAEVRRLELALVFSTQRFVNKKILLLQKNLLTKGRKVFVVFIDQKRILFFDNLDLNFLIFHLLGERNHVFLIKDDELYEEPQS